MSSRTKFPSRAACPTTSPMFARASSSSSREPEMRQLQRDVGTELLRCDAVEDLLVALDHDPRLRLVAHPFAKERRVGEKPLLVETSQHDHRLVERLAGDEAGGTEAHPVTAHDALHSGALGCGEDRLPQHCRRSRERCAPVIGADSTTKQSPPTTSRRLPPAARAATGRPDSLVRRPAIRSDAITAASTATSRDATTRAGAVRPTSPTSTHPHRAGESLPADRAGHPQPEERVAEEVDRRPGDERDELRSRELVERVGDDDLVADRGDDDRRRR